MPTLRLAQLIQHLEEIEARLTYLWGACQNYEYLAEIEALINKLSSMITTIKNCNSAIGNL